ncbi:MAG: DUF2723 domain-containing protein [Bacteroidia bacterium]
MTNDTLLDNQLSKYKKLNNIFGWIAFAVAAYVFLATIEPTASFWDCGEFISTDFKLEIGHPPGAPFLQMVARVLSLFSFGNVHKVAPIINSMSATCSAFAILFLFWSITAMAFKLMTKTGELTDGKIYAILGAGLVGALAYTFTDSFWFSAVEGEVYAMSSFFTALVFWCILKWERAVDEEGVNENRWIVLIGFLMGLSIGVHLLNLLTIPAMVFVVYFKKYKTTPKGFIITGILSILVLGGVQAGIIPWIVSWAADFELFFVNVLHFPFDIGTLVYFAVLIGAIAFGLYYTHKKNKPIFNTAILCLSMLLVGYSSFLVLVVRSQANPPLDENNPDNAINLGSYLGREQYGDWPLLYGPNYNSPLDVQKPYLDGSPLYVKDEKAGKYIISDDRKQSLPNYDPEFCTIFPRMWDQQADHIEAYKDWSHLTGERKTYTDGQGNKQVIVKPTFGDNLTYFLNYQVNFMYFRYFMWNFSGRQDDVEGVGRNLHGNWITGIPFWDEARLGSQQNLPFNIENNKGRNKYYALPLFLGLLGMFFQFKRDQNDGLVVLLFWFFTGIAIVVYLNQYPLQPRERDYAFVGSFYAFAIWIGLGALAIFEWVSKKMSSEKTAAIAVTAICLLAVPAVMAHENWDDHDRSGRYTCRDLAIDYLQSCAPNAILFTNGDNDTFPLWYVQEVEGIRTDVRVCNLSLLNTDWYIDQMKRKAYLSDAVPFALTEEQYRQGTRDYVPYYPKDIKGNIPLKQIMDFISSSDQKNQLETQSGKWINYLPTQNLEIPVDKQTVLANGTVDPALADRIVPAIDWTMKKNYVMKSDLMVLDLLAHNDWKRPIYFAVTTGPDAYMGLQGYFQLEGLAYRLVPFKSTPQEMQQEGSYVNTKLMYDNVMNKFKWGGMNTPGVYLDENIRRMTTDMRIQMGTLAQALLSENKKDSAIKVLDKCMLEMPEVNVPYDGTMFSIVYNYYQAGANAKGAVIAKRLFDLYEGDLKYYYSVDKDDMATYKREIEQAQDMLERMVYITKTFKDDALSKNFQDRMTKLQQGFIPPSS